MKAIFIILGIMISFFFNNSFAQKPPSCGVEKPCQPGYYCSGAVGEAESGVCLANSISIATCRFVDFVKSDIVKYMAIFASVFAGIYLFIGKFAIITFAQVIVGVSILFGAEKIVTQVTGVKGVCTKNQVAQCLNSVSTRKIFKNEKAIRNLDKNEINYITEKNCEILECKKALCESFKKQTTTINGIQKTECVKQSGKVEKYITASTPDISSINPLVCQAGFTISCTPINGSLARNYFECQNNCTEGSPIFGAEAPYSWNINNCQELVQKQISY